MLSIAQNSDKQTKIDFQINYILLCIPENCGKIGTWTNCTFDVISSVKIPQFRTTGTGSLILFTTTSPRRLAEKLRSISLTTSTSIAMQCQMSNFLCISGLHYLIT